MNELSTITNMTNNKITGVTVTCSHNSLSDKFGKTFLRLCSSHFQNVI